MNMTTAPGPEKRVESAEPSQTTLVPENPDVYEGRSRPTQLRFVVEADRDWELDEETRKIGLQGVRMARQELNDTRQRLRSQKKTE